MDIKRALSNGVFCPVPWTGVMFNFDGKIKNCIRSAGYIGDLKHNTIEEILHGDVNRSIQQSMVDDKPAASCHTCYDLERGKKRFDIISDRIFYLRELKQVPMETYQVGAHDLKTIDIRWSNVCNFSCVYCSPSFSSRWAAELSKKIDTPTESQINDFKNYISDKLPNLKHVYLAGGEPLLMKENLEILQILKKSNPQVNLRINTNLSKTDTQVFETICEFENVHWTVSVESIEQEFEYIRHGGKWDDFLENLEIIKRLEHKISFNMLYFLLNYRGFFECLEFLQKSGFHNNTFVAGALLQPLYLNIRHLPNHILDSIRLDLEKKIDQTPGYLLEDSLRNLLYYIQQPFEKNLQDSFQQLKLLDQRRNLDSSKIFRDLYSLA